jgi:hypothetical protein
MVRFAKCSAAGTIDYVVTLSDGFSRRTFSGKVVTPPQTPYRIDSGWIDDGLKLTSITSPGKSCLYYRKPNFVSTLQIKYEFYSYAPAEEVKFLFSLVDPNGNEEVLAADRYQSWYQAVPRLISFPKGTSNLKICLDSKAASYYGVQASVYEVIFR